MTSTKRPGKIIKATTINDIHNPLRKLTQPERVIEYLKLNPRKSAFQISRSVNLSSHTSEVIGCLETNNIIKGTPCECGKDKLYELVKYNKKV